MVKLQRILSVVDQSVSQSVSQSVKILLNKKKKLVEGFMVDRKIFLNLANTALT